MVWFIQTIPNVVERMMQHIDSPAIQDMFLRLISAEEGVSGIIEWLASEGLVKRLIALLSPEYPPTTHVIAADLLKITIHICAPQTQPFNPNGGNAQEQAGPGQSKDNRLLRDMVSEESISTMVGFMLDNLDLTDRDWKGLDENNVSPADPFVVHPLPSVTSASSSLAQICTILVELIRRNNNDFSEPHLFHTLRNRLMTIKAERLSSGAGQGEDERAIMADAMAEISPTLGIVHLGALVTQITARFGELYQHLIEPKSQVSQGRQSTRKVLTGRTALHPPYIENPSRTSVSESSSCMPNYCTAPIWPS
jgi:SIT4-associating protein SAP185/190